MRVELDKEAQMTGSLADLQKSHGRTPGLEVDPETGQLEGTYIGTIHAARVHAATARLRGTPIANYTPPPGNTIAGFLEGLKKIP